MRAVVRDWQPSTVMKYFAGNGKHRLSNIRMKTRRIVFARWLHHLFCED